MTTLAEPQTTHDRQGGVFAYLSPSRLNLWLRCPLAFKLKYLDGIRTPTSPALFVGKRVHAGLECFYRHRQLGITLSPGVVGNRVVESWDEAVSAEDMNFDSSAQEQQLQKQRYYILH